MYAVKNGIDTQQISPSYLHAMTAQLCISAERTIRLLSGREAWKEKWKPLPRMATVGLYIEATYPLFGCPNHVHLVKCWISSSVLANLPLRAARRDVDVDNRDVRVW